MIILIILSISYLEDVTCATKPFVNLFAFKSTCDLRGKSQATLKNYFQLAGMTSAHEIKQNFGKPTIKGHKISVNLETARSRRAICERSAGIVDFVVV